MKETELHALVDTWQLPDEHEDKLYSVNTVVDAYFKGKSDGLEQNNKLFKKQLQDNFAKAGKDASKVIAFLRSKGVNSISAHLKLCSVYDMSILITISDEDFLKDVFNEIYSFISHIEQMEKTDLYSISFSFINRTSGFNMDLLISDGFCFSLKELASDKKAEPKKS